MSRLARLTLPAAAAVLFLGAGCVYHSVPPSNLPPYERPISLYEARRIALNYCLRHGQRQVAILAAARVGPDRYRILLVSHPQPFATEHLRVWVASTGGAVLDADFTREGRHYMLGHPAHPSYPAYGGRPGYEGRPAPRGHAAMPAGRPAAPPQQMAHPGHPAYPSRPAHRGPEAQPNRGMGHPAVRPSPAQRVGHPVMNRPPAHEVARPGRPGHPSHPAHPATPAKGKKSKKEKDEHHGHPAHPAHD